MKKRISTTILAISIIFIMIYTLIGNPFIAYHNYELKKKITSINDEKPITLNEIVPFKWDVVYTFSPYTSKKEIEKIIGFRSNSIKETISEGMVQLLFVKDNSVVASVCSYADNLGYSINFADFVTYNEKAIFSVNMDSNVIALTKQ